MAKQTFTTGQVLTAAQMTSLQQTAMGGGEATAKTASYVLVAADAGTTVIMNAAGATTITVNTALFAAGDTVNIQNIGAGVCTITNGTATVSTAGSLALSQWEGGVLYFRSTSTATFFDYVQTGTVSPLTTKGDVWGYSTVDARIPIGTNDQVLTADSTQALGLKWATPASGGMTSIASGSLSGSSVTISSIAGTYKNLQLLLRNPFGNPNYGSFKLHFNSDTGSNYSGGGTTNNQGTWTVPTLLSQVSTGTGTYVSLATAVFNFFDYAGTTSRKTYNMFYGAQGGSLGSTYYNSILNTFTYNSNSAITSITLTPENSPWNGGTYILYGVN
jgi:hypothetical protein